MGRDRVHQESGPFAGGRRGKEFLARVVEQARAKGLTSDEHSAGRRHAVGSVGEHKRFQPKDGKQSPPDDPGNPTVNFRGERRSNETHESKTDPEAQMARKSEGKESKLSYSGNLLVENRNGLIVKRKCSWPTDGRTRRGAGDAGTDSGNQAGDGGRRKGFDTRGFVGECRNLGVTPRSRKTTRDRAEARLMAAPHATLDMRSAKERGNGSKNALAG